MNDARKGLFKKRGYRPESKVSGQKEDILCTESYDKVKVSYEIISDRSRPTALCHYYRR